MAVNNNGLGIAENSRVLLQEPHMMRNTSITCTTQIRSSRRSRICSINSETTCATSTARRQPSGRRRKGNFPEGENASLTARGRQVPLRTATWNLAGLAEDSLEPFVACVSIIMLWDVVLLQETFRELEGLLTEGCDIFTP